MTGKNVAQLETRQIGRIGLAASVCCIFFGLAIPSEVTATHEADHRFAVEGYVCGADGKAIASVDVLVKDTKTSSGQIVKTNSYGYYKATFHLHNDNLGDPILVEAGGEQQNRKVEFDPKDLESERKIRVNFGAGCESSDPPPWLWVGVGALVVGAGGVVGMRVIRSRKKRERAKGKSQGKKKS